MRKQFENHPAFEFVTADAFAKRHPRSPTKLATVPFHRRLLGDEAIQEIWTHPYLAPYSHEQQQQLAETFPEAEVREVMLLH